MDAIKVLEYLQEIIENSSKVPVTGKVVINKKEVMEIIDEIINALPDEFKKAQWISSEKERIITDAKREAHIIEQEARRQAELIESESIDKLKRKIEHHDIVTQAQRKAEEIISSAQRDAKVMRLGARDYADEILNSLQLELDIKAKDVLSTIKKEVEDLAQTMQENVTSTTSSIRENIKELRNMK